MTAATPTPIPALAPADVAVVDWGIGGADLWRQLRCARPDLAVRYRSDAGWAPWGTLPASALRARLAAIVALEVASGARLVWVACNAGSSVLPRLNARERCGVPVVGVIAPGVQALLADPAIRGQRLGVVGGRRTVRSRAWAQPLRAAGFTVQQRTAQPLSARVEAGDLDSAATQALVDLICRPLAGVERLVLACTHYPAAAACFAAALPRARLVDPGLWALQAVLAALEEVRPAGPPASPPAVTTGDPAATRRAARRAFGVDLGPVVHAQVAGTTGPAAPREVGR